jgi:hypothetical protein
VWIFQHACRDITDPITYTGANAAGKDLVYWVNSFPPYIWHPVYFLFVLAVPQEICERSLNQPDFGLYKVRRTMPEYRQTQKSDWVVTISLLGLFVALLLAGSIWLAPQYFVLFLLLGASALILLVLWHNRTFAYRCSACGGAFEISALRNFLSPHGIDTEGGWKYLKCPICKAWSRARIVKKI